MDPAVIGVLNSRMPPLDVITFITPSATPRPPNRQFPMPKARNQAKILVFFPKWI
jgi:hypothetical protein